MTTEMPTDTLNQLEKECADYKQDMSTLNVNTTPQPQTQQIPQTPQQQNTAQHIPQVVDNTISEPEESPQQQGVFVSSPAIKTPAVRDIRRNSRAQNMTEFNSQYNTLMGQIKKFNHDIISENGMRSQILKETNDVMAEGYHYVEPIAKQYNILINRYDTMQKDYDDFFEHVMSWKSTLLLLTDELLHDIEKQEGVNNALHINLGQLSELLDMLMEYLRGDNIKDQFNMADSSARPVELYRRVIANISRQLLLSEQKDDKITIRDEQITKLKTELEHKDVELSQKNNIIRTQDNLIKLKDAKIEPHTTQEIEPEPRAEHIKEQLKEPPQKSEPINEPVPDQKTPEVLKADPPQNTSAPIPIHKRSKDYLDHTATDKTPVENKIPITPPSKNLDKIPILPKNVKIIPGLFQLKPSIIDSDKKDNTKI